MLLARAMERVGWLTCSEGTAEELELADAGEIPGWALSAYLAFAKANVPLIQTWQETGERDPNDGGPVYAYLAEWEKPVQRGEAMQFLNSVREQLPWYPSQAAIDYGFDREMPVIDGSTSTYPYTLAVYGACLVPPPITPSSRKATPKVSIPMTGSSAGRRTFSFPPLSPPRIPWTRRRPPG